MIHSSEPNINTLKQIRQDLYSAESTDENLKKIAGAVPRRNDVGTSPLLGQKLEGK